MTRYEYAQVDATYYPGEGEDRWETDATLPGGEVRDFGDVGHVEALNALGAEGWELVQYKHEFFSGFAASAHHRHGFWLKRELSS